MKNKGAKQRSKKKGSDNAFGCDLMEHLQNSGHDVPQVLKICAEFIEIHGIVDGIYRLSGVTSNIQKLRQEFSSESCPDLTKEVYLQDIHCVGSLCKLYFRELPNPLLTYELYKKFTEAVSVGGDHEKLQHIQAVIKELPVSHFRTLEYLTKHLAHLATLSPQTNMHTRNLALVWAPNLLRSKDIDVSSCSGDMAFQEVRVQQSVVEFILNHTEQIFNHAAVQIKPKEGPGLVCGEKYATLPASGQGGPMKLMSLEEAQARSLSPNHPARRERQRENSLPDASTATLYHTVIDAGDSRRKFSGKSKKWKSIFNLGKSVTDSKGKLSRNGSVFMRAQNSSETAAIRPARSMDSLCSVPADDDKAGSFSIPGGPNGFFVPGMKSRTLGSDMLYDLSEQDQKWEFDVKKPAGATGGSSPNIKRRDPTEASAPLQKALPEQLKVFKGDDLGTCQPTSPKNRRMLYSGSTHSSSSSRPSFPGSLFPLESSPRHQRKALTISEPFAVSVPLRVSAVISSNSTPCRAPGKDRSTAGTAPKHSRETSQSEQSDSSGSSGYRENTLGERSIGSQHSIYSNSSSGPPVEIEKRSEAGEHKVEGDAKNVPEDVSETEMGVGQSEQDVFQSSLIQTSSPNTRDVVKEKQLDSQLAPNHESKELTKLDRKLSPEREDLWSALQNELKITEPELDLLEEEFKPVFCSTKNIFENVKPKPGAQSKRRSSLPTRSLLYKGQPFFPAGRALADDFAAMTEGNLAIKHPSDRQFSFDKTIDLKVNPDIDNLDSSYKPANNLPQVFPKAKLMDTENPFTMAPWPPLPTQAKTISLPLALQGSVIKVQQPVAITSVSATDQDQKSSGKKQTQRVKEVISRSGKRDLPAEVMGGIERLSICLEARPHTLELVAQEEEDGSGGNSEELDLVEPWEDFSSTKEWVTSPLHSPTLTELFKNLEVSPSCAVEDQINSKEENALHGSKCDKQPNRPSNAQTTRGRTETKSAPLQSIPSKTLSSAEDAPWLLAHRGTSCTAKNTMPSSQRFHRKMSHSEFSHSEKTEENCTAKHRPNSLNLDLGHRYIRDISNRQNLNSSEFYQRGEITPTRTNSTGLSLELEMFLNDRQAPMRRNSAPVSVSSVRTAFMIKTCQAKAVPVIPPKVQYSHIPHPRHDKGSDGAKGQEKDVTQTREEKSETVPPLQPIRDLEEEIENKEPTPKPQRQSITDKLTETCKTMPTSDLPVLRRKRSSNVEPFVDLPRPDRPSLLQRSSFRNRQRPQSLILFSPPFPIMDDGKLLLSPIKSPTETAALDVFSKEMVENLDGVTLRNKMTIPKSGQRLETSTSCFYQPQRRSMIFDNRSHRQIE